MNLTISPSSPSVADLQALIRRTVDAHNNNYADVLAVSIYFEDDDTGTKLDANTFARFAKIIGIKHERLVFDGRKLPQCQLKIYLHGSVAPLAAAGKALLIFHYAGHSRSDENEVYHWCAKRRANASKLHWGAVRDRLLFPDNPSDVECLRNIDVVCVLDSYDSGLATRHNPIATRSVNILAGCGDSKLAKARQRAISFTQRFVTQCISQLTDWVMPYGQATAIGVEHTNYINVPKALNIRGVIGKQ